jgi:hypothetical protein
MKRNIISPLKFFLQSGYYKKATSHGMAPSRESVTKAKEGSPPPRQVTSEWRQEEVDEESGLLRDRLFVALHIRLRRSVRHF